MPSSSRTRAGRSIRGRSPLSCPEGALQGSDPAFDLLTLDELLARLASIDARAARVAELRVLGGMTVGETAEQLGVSARTVQTDWTMARLWLSKELGR